MAQPIKNVTVTRRVSEAQKHRKLYEHNSSLTRRVTICSCRGDIFYGTGHVNMIEVRTYPKTALGEGLPTPPKTPTQGLPRLWETFGRTEWLGRETGHSDKRPLAMAKRGQI